MESPLPHDLAARSAAPAPDPGPDRRARARAKMRTAPPDLPPPRRTPSMAVPGLPRVHAREARDPSARAGAPTDANRTQ